MESRTRINHCPLTTSPPRRYGLYLSLLSGIAALFILVTASPAAEGETLKLTHLRTLTNDFAITTLAWHPDGKQLAVGQVLNKRVAIWDTQTGERARVLENEPGGVQALAYSPDGKYLAAGRSGTRVSVEHAHVHVYDAATGNVLHRFVPPPPPPKGDSNDSQAIAFSPDSRYLAAVGYGSVTNVVVYDVVSARIYDRLPDESTSRSKGIRVGSVEALTFSADGRFLAVGRNLGELEIWSIQPWKRMQRLDGQSAGVRALAFSPDGKYLASGTNIGERWDRSVKPARQMFAKFNDDVVLWSLPAFEKSAEFPSRRFKQTPNSNIIESLQFSPDGKLLLVGARAKSIEVIDITSGKTALFKDGLDAIAEPAFSPDGKHLAIGLGKKIEIHQLIAR